MTGAVLTSSRRPPVRPVRRQDKLRKEHDNQLIYAGLSIAAIVVVALLIMAYFPPGQAPLQPVTNTCITSEAFHTHARLTLRQFQGLVDGNYTWRTFYAPAGVGLPPFAPCTRPLHTHAYDGVIHMESDRARDYTLQDFFDVWGQPFGPSNVANLTYNASIGPLKFYYRLGGNYAMGGAWVDSMQPWVPFDPTQSLVLADGMEIYVGYPPI